MWALIEDGSITKLINNPKAMVIGDTRYSRNIFSFRWTNAEREAIGLYEIVWDNSKKKDEEYYTNTNQTFTYDADAGTVTATYGDATAKAHADTTWTQDEINDGKAPAGADTDTVAGRSTTSCRIFSGGQDSLNYMQIYQQGQWNETLY